MSHPYYFSPKRLQTKTPEQQEEEAASYLQHSEYLKRRMEGKRILNVY